jgi:hypothetical protein
VGREGRGGGDEDVSAWGEKEELTQVREEQFTNQVNLLILVVCT